MQFRADTLGLSGSTTAILRDVIHDRLGLYYDASQFDLVADRLAPLIVARGLSSFMDYYYLLKYSDDDGEWLNVMDALAVHETFFWREIDQLRAIVDVVVPRLVQKRHQSPLRLWSVPCAMGEEPLTLAMLLTEAGWFDRAPIEIVASDASPEAIGRALRGFYTRRAFRNLPPAMREKYFSAHDDGWLVDPALQRRVSYDVVNLMDDRQVSRHATAPVIFCRNVFIYFSDHSIRRALAAFEHSMPSPGYLCVGAAESLIRRTARFELQEIGGAFMYVKDPATAAAPEPVFGAAEGAS